jgi:signal transduction histidine kinase
MQPSQIWSNLSLASRFGLAMAVVLVLAGLAIGAVVTRRIEEAVVRNSASATAIYMESILSPITQQLATQGTLSEGAQRALDEIFNNTTLGARVVSYKFWREDGFLIDASNRDLIGQVFELTEDLRRAWDGEVMADFDALGDAEDAAEAALGLPLLEIYSPIREVWSGEVIAVAEFYEINTELRDALRNARLTAWATVAGALGVIGLVLYAIVLGGSRTIVAQRRALDMRLADLADLSDRNRDLRLRIQAAAGRAAQANEDTMRRIGADLHDGPAQHLAFAALRLDSIGDGANVGQVRDAVTQAMHEIRALSRGLSLPEVAGKPLAEVVQMAVEAHEVRSGHDVTVEVVGDDLPDAAIPLRIALFRFVQEGLNNASRHAGGQGLHVALGYQGAHLVLSVADRGPGPGTSADGGMGLAGLRDRVEALGGQFSFAARPGGGSLLTMQVETGKP